MASLGICTFPQLCESFMILQHFCVSAMLVQSAAPLYVWLDRDLQRLRYTPCFKETNKRIIKISFTSIPSFFSVVFDAPR